jgi:hypothetical protein
LRGWWAITGSGLLRAKLTRRLPHHHRYLPPGQRHHAGLDVRPVSLCARLADRQDCWACWPTSGWACWRSSLARPRGQRVLVALPGCADGVPSLTSCRWRSARVRLVLWPASSHRRTAGCRLIRRFWRRFAAVCACAGFYAAWWLSRRLRPGVSRMRMCFCWTATRPSSWNREKARETVSSLSPR